MGLNKACTFFSATTLYVDVQIQAGWLKGTKALRSLKLEGNLLTSLDSGSFPLNGLRDLESLDVSDNLIIHLDKNRLVHFSFMQPFSSTFITHFVFAYCAFLHSHISYMNVFFQRKHRKCNMQHHPVLWS